MLDWNDLGPRLREGDRRAQEIVVGALYETVSFIARKRLIDKSKTDDVVIEGLTAALDRIQQGKEIAATGWIAFFSSRVSYKAGEENKRTKKQREREGVSLDAPSGDLDGDAWSGNIPDGSKTPGAIVADDEQLEFMKSFLGLLPVEQREPIVLRFYKCMTYREIGIDLDVPQGTTVDRIKKGLETIRSKMLDLFLA